MNKHLDSVWIVSFLIGFWKTCISILKIILQSKRVDRPQKKDNYSDIIILGNGPSLTDLVHTKSYFLESKAKLAVNYAVLSDYYNQLKPEYYLIADSGFFVQQDHCEKFFSALAQKTDWPLELYLSTFAFKNKTWQSIVRSNPHIHINYFNMTPVDGFKWFRKLCFTKGWGLPRPRNVLIPSIMVALKMPYENIYLAGADHSWFRDVFVDEDNILRENLMHFYDKKGENEYKSKKKLHEFLLSLSIAFASYHIVEEYARSIDRKIINITEGSYIDAFRRRKV